ncbi:P-loop containing nucleoside triphosphate hydrolase protein [Gymnopilus junonius]|uniref:P-loop containing nucleoside triphosphate hydrolase protein n=1 Tax=Gymnopilus junonius TaxID=109634 RepID=A0A9P5TPJ4_GYMJU|nr:P-loop containing nucleoside triphosphate hydrolase protein [Gymnopilus junonius]
MQCWKNARVLFRNPSRRYNSTIAPVVLRPYQEHCLRACTDALASGSTRIGVSLPTGSGKTTVFITLLSRISPPAENSQATKSLIVVNSIELARQSADQLARLFPHWHVEIEQGTKHQASGLADVTIATYQTLNNEQRLLKFDPKTLKAIIIDEAHHAAAPSYRRLLAKFDLDIKHQDVEIDSKDLTHKIPIIGFSATFGRHDRLALGSIFERIVYHRTFLEMIKEEWLCDVRFTTVQAKIDLNNVTINSRTGDFNPTSLAHVINADSINELVVRTWIDRASTRKSTLVFCVNVAHVVALAQTFRRYGIDARYLSAKTPAPERKTLIREFREGVFPVLVNCAILTEGADIPNIDCVVLARPTRSRNLYAQMIGRGMRQSPNTGKADCRIIDFVDNQSRVNGLVTSPTLFGLNPGELEVDGVSTILYTSFRAIISLFLLDETPESLERLAADSQDSSITNSLDDVPNPMSITYIDYDDPFNFEVPDDKPGHITILSPFSWIDCGNDIYVLELLSKGFIRVERSDEGHFVARYTPASYISKQGKEFSKEMKIKTSPYLASREILTHETLSDAISGCDTFASNNVFRNTPITGLLRSAEWRTKPASDAQKKVILKRWVKSPLSEEEKLLKVEAMNKGNAATIITRLRHGAQVRFSLIFYLGKMSLNFVYNK